jgi:hypothetical protein
MKDANKAAEKWANGMVNASQAMKDGAASVTTSPTQKAKQAKNKMLMGIQNAISDGTYDAGCDRVSAEDWKKAYNEKAIPRIQAQAPLSKPKVAEHLRNFLPFVDSVVNAADQMPTDTIDQRIAKSAYVQKQLSTYKKPR